jgi:hypothetical protein
MFKFVNLLKIFNTKFKPNQMKKVLLTVAVAAISFATNAQSAVYTANGFSTGFDGNDTTNCGVVIPGKRDSYMPSSKFTNAGNAYTNIVTGNGSLSFNVDGSAVGAAGWHKVFLQFHSDCGTPANVDLSDAANKKFTITLTSSADVKEFMVMAMDPAENFGDNSPIIRRELKAGTTTITTTIKDFMIYSSDPLVKNYVDSTIIAGIGLYFRTAWDNPAALADISVDFFAIGDKVTTVGIIEEAAILNKTVSALYNLQGQPVSADYQGLVIVKYSDGTVSKIFQ